MIVLLAVLFGAATPDSLVLAAADSLLQASDTLGAVERLQSHADTVRVTLKLSDMLDRLVLPESSDVWASGVDSLAGAAKPMKPTSTSARSHWILAGQVGRDEGGEMPFWASTQALRQIPWNPGQAMGHIEWGISQLVADVSSDWLASTDAIARVDLGWAYWLGGLQTWVGTNQDAQSEVGVAGSLLRLDTSRIGKISWGPEARVSRNRTSWLGLIGRWERPEGLRVSSALRWRREPSLRLEQNNAVYEWATSRLQCQGAISWLQAWRMWRIGPMLEGDWRKSTQEDFWADGDQIERPIRQESTFCVGGILAVGAARRWSIRLRPSWVFAHSEPFPLLEGGSDVDGLRVSIDGILVL